jgi:type I restriction enzyme S subunit
MDRLPVPLPPLAEQKRIVEKVDELMMLCDRLEASQAERESRRNRLVVASLNRLSQPTDPDEFKKDARFQLSNLNRFSTKPEHIKELRKAILNLAVKGKLVPQDEREGTAANSLRTLGMQPADPPPDFEDRVLPSSWCMIRFDDVATISGGVTLGRKLGGRKTASVPYLRVANVQRGGFDLSVIKEVDVPVEEVEKYSLKENDLLMTEGGDWDKVGRSAIWRNQIPLCLHQNHVFRVRMNSSEISPVWFERYFNSPAGRAYFESCSKQTTNLASINMRQVRGCPVPLPPLAEQKRIVTKVDELMLICDQLENQLETQQKGRRQLLEALLHEALVEVG